jgi:hypothetical protein
MENMAKTNYSKVEEALAEGLQKISVEQLQAAAPSAKDKKMASEREKIAVRLRVLNLVRSNLDYLQKQGHTVYEQFEIKKSMLKKWIENPSEISAEEWKKIQKLKADLTEFKKSLEKGSTEEINETLLKQQAKENLTQRFNVNKKWLPLK